ncbi:hypothetical protein FI667_g16121, partial [Globisporangium splendens]
MPVDNQTELDARDSDVRDSDLKRLDSFPEDEEHYVSEDGHVIVAPVDDKTRIDKYRRLLAKREREVRQAAAYGLGLLEANEKLQLDLTALQIQLECEVEELTVERDAFKRHNDHALLETEHWKRKYVRLEEQNNELGLEFEQFAAQCTCRNAGGALQQQYTNDTVRELTVRVAELELALTQMHASEQAKEATITNLQSWKDHVELERQESQEMNVLETRRDQSLVLKLEEENAKLRKAMQQLSGEMKQLELDVSAAAQEHKQAKKELQLRLDELTEARLECSAKSELLLTAEAKCSRLQRELSLLEHVSYLSSLAVIDHDTEEDDEDDEEVIHLHPKKPKDQVSASKGEDDVDVDGNHRQSMAASDLMPSPFTAFPSTAKAPDATVSASDLESHKKLHHYFHLTAQSIIHENKLHDKCFRSSSRFTIDSWYREIIALDIPYLEWHAWLISRISQVAASVQDEDKEYEPLLSITAPKTGLRKQSQTHFSGFFLRKDLENSPVSASHNRGAHPFGPTTETASPSNRLVPFSVARAFFRFLRKRQDPEQDSSSEEQE